MREPTITTDDHFIFAEDAEMEMRKAIKERRERVYSIDGEQFTMWMAALIYGRGECHVPVPIEVPKGAAVTRAWMDHSTLALKVCIAHPSFEPCEPGTVRPYLRTDGMVRHIRVRTEEVAA